MHSLLPTSHFFIGLVWDVSWNAKDLKEQMHQVAYRLYETFPVDYPNALAMLNHRMEAISTRT
jgi:hypothetical protein